MTKKDILELKRRMKKEACTFTKLCGCYVDGNKNIILKINETFLNLKDEEFFKYLDIAKKALSGTIGNNLLELEFAPVGEGEDSMQSFLLGIRDSKLKNEALLDRLYEKIIEKYDYTGNYLILLFHDAYDVVIKTSDNNKLDESEEVYDYVLCAVCPVELSKAALGYREDENRIGARMRDWVVGMPEVGFLYPAFTDRSTDIHAVMYYTKDAKETHTEFMEEILGCKSRRSGTEEKETFKSVIENVIGDDEQSNEVFIKLQKNLNYMIEEEEALNYGSKEPLMLTNSSVKELMEDTDISDEIKGKIEKAYDETFGEEPPEAKNLLDKKALEQSAKRDRTVELEKQVNVLKQQLENKKSADDEPPFDTDETSFDADEPLDVNFASADISLNVSQSKLTEIKTEIIDGKKCIVIPVEEGESTSINGVNTVI
ncbi:DUF4317 domain-containing protein [Anaerotignum sp. MSJ-24]|uniref:DUF4317 domain-containing protein n=1 Tax=Anaerotignum sp. MSJ-24 TaxID=2841521 RepID=UPI001C126443|nr:DUF4317 domain-containing protein [Anaerotignum sp. MSJ-24]MBU5463516.1 DUF4317 domain-containing protein [Anaerotignum sp. MSJ-24]